MLNDFRGGSPLQDYLAARKDTLAFLKEVTSEAGDFARIKILSFRFYLVNDPDLIREALVEKSDVFIIKGGASAGLARLIGHGILTNRGDDWRESRRGLQPLFNQDALESYASKIRDLVQESLDRWKTKFEGRAIPISREILALSYRITSSTLFRTLPTFEEAEEFADAIWVLQSDGMRRYLNGLDYLGALPLPINRKVNRAKATLKRLGLKAIEAGAGQSLDEILSIFYAGTESPANTVCWALKLLEDHPEWNEKLRRASDSGEEGSDLLSKVIAETLRLYPAGWAFERCADRDATLGGEKLKKSSRLLFSPFLLHRNPRFWRDPECFDPMRFENAYAAPPDVPKYAYLPFGAGPRSCIGSRMAWMEMRTLLGMIVSQCRWKIEKSPDGVAPFPQGSFKIRFDRPLFARLDFTS